MIIVLRCLLELLLEFPFVGTTRQLARTMFDT
ncbi:hypothetical protein GLYMA_01G086650v4 [Glycine max]|nr:hypothetical protein GLYMA_01G086650v4 [Glycine max]KAH1162241.1 hypothetical protein GYH30_000930 [Glycine max]